MDRNRRIADATGEMTALGVDPKHPSIVAIDLEHYAQKHGFHEPGLAHGTAASAATDTSA